MPVPDLVDNAVEAVAEVVTVEPELGTELADLRRVSGVRGLAWRHRFVDIELPLGPALVRQGPARGKDVNLGDHVEGVTYWCAVPQAGRVVALTVHWRDQMPGIDMQDEARSLAESLTFVRL